MGREELRDRIGTDFYSHGLFIENTYLLQPAALIRGLAETLPPQVRLFENTPVARLARRNGSWLLTTPEGTVDAETVVLAAHSFTRSLGYLADRVVAVMTYSAMTEPLPPETLSALGGDVEWGISPTFKYGTTMRRLRNGRLMVRSLYSYEKEFRPKRRRSAFTLRCGSTFPSLKTPHSLSTGAAYWR